MGKALIAVGTFLAICFAVFGGVVYFTRDEDTYAVDSLLSESITKEIAQAEARDTPVDLRALVDFDFDRVLVFGPGTPRARIDGALGFEFKGELRYTAESSRIFVFTNRGGFVRFADYRGRVPIEGLPELEYLTAGEAVFEVRDGVARLA